MPNTDRCEVTELPRNGCAHCKGTKDNSPVATRERGRTGDLFEARYPGKCAGCGDAFAPGNQIRSNDAGGYLCTPCGEDHDA